MDTKPSTYYHPVEVKRFNTVTRLYNLFGLKKIELSDETLIAQARSLTGLERFGNECFREPLRVLLKSLQEETRLNPFGRAMVKGRILRSLKNRLWANACFEKHPEILQRKIVAPVIIVGAGRSGTTRLQRMLAADSRMQHLKAWEGFNPAPRPGLPDMGKVERRAEIVAMLHEGQRINPGASTAHPMDADWAEEEILLLNHSFSGLLSLCFQRYYDWFLDYDRTNAYRYMADLMKLLSWSRGDSQSKTWVMKTPQFMLDLDTVMKVFPDARIVFIHRDPSKTVASTMSLMWHFAVQNIDRPCRAEIRDVWLGMCEEMAKRCIQARESIPPSRYVDVYYEEMNHDWRAAMRRIYALLDMEFSAKAEQEIGAWLAQSEGENRHGGHHYSYEEFGADAKEVESRMMFYRQRFFQEERKLEGAAQA
ncbi:MAG TPA: sulfotransferase [Noviherbaspirillum sp.]